MYIIQNMATICRLLEWRLKRVPIFCMKEPEEWEQDNDFSYENDDHQNQWWSVMISDDDDEKSACYHSSGSFRRSPLIILLTSLSGTYSDGFFGPCLGQEITPWSWVTLIKAGLPTMCPYLSYHSMARGSFLSALKRPRIYHWLPPSSSLSLIYGHSRDVNFLRVAVLLLFSLGPVMLPLFRVVRDDVMIRPTLCVGDRCLRILLRGNVQKRSLWCLYV